MDVAAEIYARMIFPEAAAQSDPYLSQLQKAMLAATPDCIKVLSVDGQLLTMNKAGCIALNIPEDSEFGMPWLPLLAEDVHVAGAAALRSAASGQAASFPGKSLSSAETVYWDNLLTPLIDTAGRVVAILCVSRDVTEKVLLTRKLEEAVERERLLAQEMQHRIKNLFSVTAGLISVAEREALANDDPGATSAILRGKVEALARASDTVFAQRTAEHDHAPMDVQSVVASVLQPYAGRFCAMGDAVSIRHEHMTVFALFLHELATNSVKSGALSESAGRVTIRWSVRDDAIDLTWAEAGGPRIAQAPERLGFGTEMVDRVVRSVRGTVARSWRPEGLVVDLHFPKFA